MSKHPDIPDTLADYKAWLVNKYPTRKWVLDISQETYRLLKENQLKKLEKK